MSSPLYLLAASSILLAAWQGVPPHRPAPAADLCRDCAPQGIGLNPYEVPSFFAARFLVDGKLFTPAGALADYTKGDCQVSRQLRFGSVYLAEGNHSDGFRRQAHPLMCVRGMDTMVVFMRPLDGWGNYLYDSIPFRPGRYELVEMRWDTVLTVPRRLKMRSFAIYYARHAAELKRANPFAGCQFAPHQPDPSYHTKAYVPATPADIFRLLLVHKRYLSIRPWKLRPLTAAEHRTLNKASIYH